MPKAKYYYHGTSPRNVDKILANGLVPKIGCLYRLHYEEFNERYPNNEQGIYPCVFFAPTPRLYVGQTLFRVRRDLLDPRFIFPDIVIGKFRKCIRYRRAIPPEYLEICKPLNK